MSKEKDYQYKVCYIIEGKLIQNEVHDDKRDACEDMNFFKGPNSLVESVWIERRKVSYGPWERMK